MSNKYSLRPVVDGHGNKISNLYKRNGVYYLQAEVRRKRYCRASPFTSVTQSAKWARDFIRTAKAGRAEAMSALEASRARSAWPRIGRLFDVYREASVRQYAIDGKPAASTVRKNIAQVENLVRQVLGASNVAELLVDQLNAELVERYVEMAVAAAGEDYRLQSRYRVTASSTVRQAKSLFTRWAMNYYRGRLDLPPCIGAFVSAGKSAKRSRYQIPPAELREKTLAEAETLRKAAPDLHAVFALCYDMGMRAGEAVEARWTWIEEEGVNGDLRRFMHICRRSDWKGPKNAYDHKVPVSTAAWQALQEVRMSEDPYILPGGNKTARRNLVGRRFAAWMREIGWDPDTYPKAAHELRKLAGSMWYTRAGLQWAARWLGDSAATVDYYYADLTEHRAPVEMR